MTRYVKLIDNRIEFAPKNKGSILNYDKDVERLKADGYKLFVKAEGESTNRRFHLEYEEFEEEIHEVRVYEETQEEADERERQEKEDSENYMTMTALDFVTMLKEVGVTDEEIEEFLNNHLSIKHQLGFCQNVYCGVAKSLCPITVKEGVVLTPEVITIMFKRKNGLPLTELEEQILMTILQATTTNSGGEDNGEDNLEDNNEEVEEPTEQVEEPVEENLEDNGEQTEDNGES